MSMETAIQDWKKTLLRLVDKVAEENYDLAMSRCEKADIKGFDDVSGREEAEVRLKEHLDKLIVVGQHMMVNR